MPDTEVISKLRLLLIRRRFSSADIGPGDPVEAWRAWRGDEFHAAPINSNASDAILADCEVKGIGKIDITCFSGRARSFVRRHSTLKRYNADAYVVILMDNSIGAFEHNGRSSSFGKGDVAIFDATKPYSITYGVCRQILSVTIPREIFDSYFGGAARASGIKIDGRQSAALIIQDYLRSLARNSENLATDTARRMSLTAVDLIATGFAEKLALEAPPRDSGDMKVLQACAFIDENLADVRLCLPTIAAAVGVSPRRLHKIFAAKGMSAAERIWESRLLRAHKLLADDPRGHAAVGVVAAHVGFTSAAHFARRFKARFGCTPSEHQGSFRQQSSYLSKK